jgi:hypothetical protein
MFPMRSSYFLYPSDINYIVNVAEVIDIRRFDFNFVLVRKLRKHYRKLFICRKIDDDRIMSNRRVTLHIHKIYHKIEGIDGSCVTRFEWLNDIS